MKSFSYCLLASLLPLALTQSVATRSLAEFEERFVDSLPYTSGNNTVRLVGFKRIYVPKHEVRDWEAAWHARPAEWNERGSLDHLSHFFYDAADRAIRVYFPVEGALLRHQGNGDHLFEADHLGQLPHSVHATTHLGLGKPGGCNIIGRRQTDQVTGVEGNVIRDGTIYLAEAAKPVRSLDERTFIYDFGIKAVHEHDHGHGHDHARDVQKRDGKKGCLQNHNGKNCSKAYGINQGRCPMNEKTCMDYNGFKTDCKKGTTTKFGIPTFSKVVKLVGSDCSVSLARGHCWNEVM